MIIYKPNGVQLLDVAVDDNSYRHREIMGDNDLTLYFALAEHVEIPIGAYADYQGERYTLMRPEALTMHHTRYFEYTVTLDSVQYKARIWKFRNPVDGRLKFSLTAKPHEHLQMFVDNMNRRDTGWTIGECIDGTEQLISYDHAYCWAALGQMADEFKTEFEIVGKRVSLRKVEYAKTTPLPLSYGRGNGFVSGVGRSNDGDTPPVEILYCQGGDRNISLAKYGASELHLPKNAAISYDGEHFEDETEFKASNARRYLTDDLGLSVRRLDGTLASLAEDSLDCSDIYPKRVGTVSEVVVVNEQNNFYDFIDNSIPETLDYSACLIEGEKMTVIFQSGMLAGREFDVEYHHHATSKAKGRRFAIVPQDIDGQTMPNDPFKPCVNDTYAIFHCQLPQAYINEPNTKKGAEWDMLRQAVKYLYDHEEQAFTFSGTLDGIWAKKDWENIGGRIRLGAFVLFSDDRFQREGVRVRIFGIKDYINKPHSPEIDLSNTTVTGSFSNTIQQLASTEVIQEENHRSAVQFTRRRFRDAQETLSMLEAAMLDNFSNAVNPITVQTMAMLVGDESLQFQFVDNASNPHVISHTITYDCDTKTLHCPSGTIQHLTLGINSVSSEHATAEYKFWDVPEYISGRLDNGEQKYYLYAVCEDYDRALLLTGGGEFRLSSSALPFKDTGRFNLLVGILNSEYDGERSFATLYGFTEILPGRITTDRVVSGNGQSFFDLVANAMKLGDCLKFNTEGDGKLTLKGTLVQSQSGDTEYIGCYRGIYNPTYTYYRGDEVSYALDGCTSMYRFISDSPARGIDPTHTLYWQVVAQGSEGQNGADGQDGEKGDKGDKGEDGKDGKDGISPNAAFKSTAFIRTNGTPRVPTGGTFASPVPTGWSDGIPSGEAKLWATTRIFSSDGQPPQQAVWSTPRQMTDTSDFDVEYSSVETPDDPTGHPNTNEQWSNAADDSTIWMATSQKRNGVWSDWQVSKIKGESGEDGTSINVKGTFSQHAATKADVNIPTARTYAIIDTNEDAEEDSQAVWYAYWNGLLRLDPITHISRPFYTYTKAQIGDAFVSAANGHLFMADTDHWQDIGQFKGDKGDTGANGKNAYLHIKYAKSLTENDWSDNNGETPDQYIGVYSDNIATDRLVWSLYSWSKWQGEDGYGYEYIYKRTAANTAPVVPVVFLSYDNPQADDFVPRGWTDDPTGVNDAYPYEWVAYRKKTAGVWGDFIGSSSDATKAALWAKFGKDGEDGQDGQDGKDGDKGDKGDKGDTGKTGDYTELRFAKNGSTTEAPALTATALNPTGWSTTTPSVSKGEYLWMTSAKKSGDGLTLKSNWTNPVRMTPQDGQDGRNGQSPVMVYRGIYNASKDYYGNANRLDCVKQGNAYYIARIDAGTFRGIAPPDTAKWNAFGASFESVATNLLLAEGANIGDWFISGGRIVSTLESGDIISLDAKANRIVIRSATAGGGYVVSGMSSIGSEIALDASQGIVQASATNGSNAVSYLSPTGVFANTAGTSCVSSTTGLDHRASIVGLGFGNLAKQPWQMSGDDNLIAGVYGNASNSGTAPSYGGFFYNLKTCGLILGMKYISGSQTGVYLSNSHSLVVSYSGLKPCNVYLPVAEREGQTIFFKQQGSGYMRVYTQSGQKIYDDNTANDYYDCGCGQGLIFHYVRGVVNNVSYGIWLVSRYKF